MWVAWLPRAVKTRDAQLDYIAKRNPIAAISQGDEIARQVAQLAEQPEIGRPGRVVGTRELVISKTPFIVVYRVTINRVELMRVVHTSQQYPPQQPPVLTD